MAGSLYPRTLQMCGDFPEANCSTRDSAALAWEGVQGETCTKCFQRNRPQITMKHEQKVARHPGPSLPLCLDVTCSAVSFLFVCVRVGFRGHVETNSMLPPVPSHLPLTHWCLPGASGLRLWLWLSEGETVLHSSAVCCRQGHTVWLQTHLPSSTSPDFFCA